MINQAPNKGGKYSQGLYVPKNKEKVIKLNSYGGIFYRSSYEKKIMQYLDINPNIVQWCAEWLEIPYELIRYKNGEMIKTTHRYFPDIYYILKTNEGVLKKVVAEIKPYNETIRPVPPKNATKKQLTNFEYAITQYNKNLAKWEAAVNWCKTKDIDFIIITEKYLNFLK